MVETREVHGFEDSAAGTRAIEGRDVLMFIDNIYRYTLAGVEVSALLGRMPSAVGYQPTLAEEMGRLQERITSTKTVSITSIQAVYVPADDFTDPAVAETFTHLDSSIVLSREMASQGLYPAIDPLASTSIMLDPRLVGPAHYALAEEEVRLAAETASGWATDAPLIFGGDFNLRSDRSPLFDELGERFRLSLRRKQALRYGENPDQAAAFYWYPGEPVGLADGRQRKHARRERMGVAVERHVGR